MIVVDTEHRCAFSIFGEDEHPSNTRRPAQVLAFASAYLELLERFAADQDEPIEFEGIDLTDNCITAVTWVSNPAAGRRAAWAANQAIKDPEAYQPRGVSPLVTTCRDLGRRFGQPARISIGGDWTELVEYQPTEDAGLPWAITTVRARLVRAGVKPPAIRLEPVLGGDDFSAKVTQTQIKALRDLLGQEIEVEVLAARDARGRLERAELCEFWAVADEPPEVARAAWEDWFSAATREDER